MYPFIDFNPASQEFHHKMTFSVFYFPQLILHREVKLSFLYFPLSRQRRVSLTFA
nr:hypothetical protein [uncultured bacterium]